MIHQLFLLTLLIGAIGAIKKGVETDDGWIIHGDFYMSTRAQKQSEAFNVCNDRGKKLVRIDNSAKNAAVYQFLYLNEVPKAWTSGLSIGSRPCYYSWGLTSTPMTYTNWQTTPICRGNPDWVDSGIVITRSSGGKWQLELEGRLYPALCE